MHFQCTRDGCCYSAVKESLSFAVVTAFAMNEKITYAAEFKV